MIEAPSELALHLADPGLLADFALWPEEEQTLRIPEPLTVSEWADRHRWVSGRTAAAPGPWRTDFIPQLREIMDAFGDPWVEEITLMMATQTGKTEAWMNMLGYMIDHDPLPGSALIVYPRDDDCSDVCTERIRPMIEDSEALAAHLTGNADDVKTMQLRLDRLTVDLTSARSPSGLAAMPRRVLIFDETDKYPPWSGKEASPLKLGQERQKTYWNKKTLNACSPTTEEGYINQRFEAGSQEAYWVDCPHCGYWQTLEFEHIHWPEDERDPERIVSERLASYHCPHCGEEIPDHLKPAMLRRGKWVSAKYEAIDPATGHVTGSRPARLRHRSFRASTLYAPQPHITWSIIAAEFLDSKDKPQQLMNFINSWLGKVWKDKAAPPQESELLALAWHLPALVCPEWSVAVTLGVDMQSVGFWFTAWAWSRELESALVQYGYVPSWSDVWDLAHRTAYRVDGRRLQLPIWRGALDTGGTKEEDEPWSRTEEAYAELRAHGRNRVWGVKGLSANPTGQKIRHRVLDRTPSGSRIPGGLVIFLLDSAQLRDDLYARLGSGTVLCPHCNQLQSARDPVCAACGEALPPRRQTIHLHQGVGEDFARHLLGVEKVRQRNGQYTWEKKRKHDLFDASLYAHACADPQWWGGVSRLRVPKEWAESAAPAAERSETLRELALKEAGRRGRRVRGGFVNGWRSR